MFQYLLVLCKQIAIEIQHYLNYSKFYSPPFYWGWEQQYLGQKSKTVIKSETVIKSYKYWSFGEAELLQETIIALLINLLTEQWSLNQSHNWVNSNSRLPLSASGPWYDCCSVSTGRQIFNQLTWLPSAQTDSCSESQTVTNAARQTLLMSLKETPVYRDTRTRSHITDMEPLILIVWVCVCVCV